MFEGCQPCNKEGLKCENDYITLKPGYWWKWYNDSVKGLYKNYTLNLLSLNPSFDSNRVKYPFPLPMPHECPRKESCLGGLNSKCEQGYEGPLCEVCSHGYYKHLQTCKECPTKAWMAGQLTITFVLLLLLVVVVVWTSIKKNKENRERALVDIILARLKIVIGFYQATFGVLDAFTFIKWPDSLAAIAKYSAKCSSDCCNSLSISSVKSGCICIWEFVCYPRNECSCCCSGWDMLWNKKAFDDL